MSLSSPPYCFIVYCCSASILAAYRQTGTFNGHQGCVSCLGSDHCFLGRMCSCSGGTDNSRQCLTTPWGGLYGKKYTMYGERFGGDCGDCVFVCVTTIYL
jgi:hypothetical protein